MKSFLVWSVSFLVCVVAQPQPPQGHFVETFDATWEQRWHVSHATKVENEDVFLYDGEWSVTLPSKPVTNSTPGLMAGSVAKRHGISAMFPTPLTFDAQDVVIHYELKLENGLECGGAYIKLLSVGEFQHEEFNDQTPYTIMFGPDKCSHNKVHFIFRHVNPLDGSIEEKHMSPTPAIKSDRRSNAYTLVLRPDNTFSMYINMEESESGSLLESFSPPVNPPKEIDDPLDVKPSDWIDDDMMDDPDEVKPEDWDENAPYQIADPDAVMPGDWLENEPLTVADPDSIKPADWDDDEDGDWEPTTIANPACEVVSGCGEWHRPIIVNPDYKGKWYPQRIPNPAYKGEWVPRQIPNPGFFEDFQPFKTMTPIAGIGIELWTMQNGIIFNNFYIGSSFEDVQAFYQQTTAVKNAQEAQADESENTSSFSDSLDKVWAELERFFTNVMVDPVDAVQQQAGVAVVLVVFPLGVFLILAAVLYGGPDERQESMHPTVPVAQRAQREQKEQENKEKKGEKTAEKEAKKN
eukprot:Lithocolla_globosa_v1_NODE_2834_length_1853_cov_142.952169.p1 type:complete len:521 gc:universal NODE_2834_length_1853_cov_142.952169:1790-228(-)